MIDVIGRANRRIRNAGQVRLSRPHRLWLRVLMLAIVFVAYALQTGTLNLQSMWIDEVMALQFTAGSFFETVRTIIKPSHNGPLFYLLLFGWRQLAGDSDFAIRYLSLFFAVLTIPLLFQWARKVSSHRTAAVAVWLFAFSPFTLWFAQEAKMYTLHVMVAVASSLALWEAFHKGGWWRWAVYTLLVPTVLYSHLFGACLVASQALMALLLGWRRWRRLSAYGAAMLLLALLHLPLFQFVWRVFQGYQPRDIWLGFVPLDNMVRDCIAYFFYRRSVPEIAQITYLLPIWMIFGGGLLLLLLRRAEKGVILLQAFVPILIFYAIEFRIPVFKAKYLCATLPALFVLAAWAVEALARLWRPLGALILVLGMLILSATVRDLTDPIMQRGDWRFVTDYVEAHEGPNDVVLVFADYTKNAFNRYYHGASKVRGFGYIDDPWPAYQRQAEEYDRIWLVLHHDQAMAPGHQLREVAAAAFPVITEQYPNGGQIKLVGYQMRYVYPDLPPEAHPLDACFQNGLCLAGYRVDATELVATERLSHPPSNWIHAVLYWRRETQVDAAPFRPLVRLVDDAFSVWGGNMDRRPDLFDRYPPNQWPLDGIVETHVDVNLNPVTPPGTYRLEVSLALDGDEGRRVTLVDSASNQPADRLVFESIQIQPRRW